MIDSNSPIPYLVEATRTYRIIRARAFLGDEPLQMPENVAIDLKTNSDFGNPVPPGPTPQVMDVLFAPLGRSSPPA